MQFLFLCHHHFQAPKVGISLLFSCIPGVAASSLHEMAFPDIAFQDFSDFIRLNFNSEITLSSVLVMLLTLTENVQLLSLHGYQQKKKYEGERSTSATA